MIVAGEHGAAQSDRLPLLADALGLTEAHRPRARATTSPSSAPGPAGLAAAVYARVGRARHDRDRRPWRPAARREPARRSRTTSASRPASPARRSPGARRCRRRSSARGSRSRARSAALDCESTPYRLRARRRRVVRARAVVVATGARYRKLDVPDYERFEGQGIHYAATAMEAQLCAGEEVGRRRRRQLGRPGGGVPVAHRAPRPHPGARRAGSPRRCPTTSSSASRRRRASRCTPHARSRALRRRRAACARSTWTNRETGRGDDARASATSS